MPAFRCPTPEFRTLPCSLHGCRQEDDMPGTIRFLGAEAANTWLFAMRRDLSGHPTGIAWVARTPF